MEQFLLHSRDKIEISPFREKVIMSKDELLAIFILFFF